MARYVFNLPTVQATQTVRLDTALGSDSPASGLLAADGTAIGSTLTADHIGFLPEVQGPDGVSTLYVKLLAYGGAVTGTPVAVTGLSQQAAPAPTGGSSAVLTAKSADYTAADGDAVLMDATAAPRTVTLPAPTANASVWVKKADVSANAVTVVPHGAETIDGSASAAITTAHAALQLNCDGTNWWVF